jgi:hypothetical protein
MAVREFAKALFKHWLSLMGSAVFTGLGIYAAWRGKTSQWIVAASIVLGVALFFVAAFLAWKDERNGRLKAEAQSSWRTLGERFKGINDNGAVTARWEQELKTTEFSWVILGTSMILNTLCTEMCKEAGRKLSTSKPLVKKFPDIAAIQSDRDRWLVAILQILETREVRGNAGSILSGKRTDSQYGVISQLTETSQALCSRLSNEEDI